MRTIAKFYAGRSLSATEWRTFDRTCGVIAAIATSGLGLFYGFC